ncbi:MAG: bifunctional diaminohydroxyphosphoribosylaminopyrimidine deaminase/5-amino-6-(5-phosphoribosylamino)uracil reductase RibD [bacterium]|nr:bifunctional diaminohydroxyphosphoribosylaminopyrimidine deaminase/5-amino-6-(5-phosphoribosylamino)uracil reductase RibD [bacterium]
MNGVALSADAAALRLLLEELGHSARAWRFSAAPNPCVGAAVLSGTRILSKGFHEWWGGPHAEVNAFAAAAVTGVARADWDTLVVTLEPCSTAGKTGACVDAILETGIKTVIVGALDPDPAHQGVGLERLRQAGIEVRFVEGESRLEDVSPHFLRWNEFERRRRPRPWTIAKWAQTLSGQLLPPQDVGDGRWISGPEALADVQVLRSRVEAVVTGVGTVVADDPRLTVRPPGHTNTPPARVVLDSVLRTRPDARLLAPDGPDERGGPVHVLCQRGVDRVRLRALEEAGAHVHEMRGDDRENLVLRNVQTWLWEQGFQRVLLECGPTLLGSYFEAGFVDQLRVVTGNVRGGRGDSLATALAAAKLIEREDTERGDDAVLEAFIEA